MCHAFRVMFIEFIPLTMQVDVPLPEAQLVVLEAAVAALPADTLRLEILEALYVNVHCAAAGSLPVGELRVRLKVVLPPGLTEAEDNDNVSVWPNKEPERRLRLIDILSINLMRSNIGFRSCDRNCKFPSRTLFFVTSNWRSTVRWPSHEYRGHIGAVQRCLWYRRPKGCQL